MTRTLRVGISTCPNDTFLFHGLLAREVEAAGLELRFELADIEELNEGMRRGHFDVAKVSGYAALELAPRTRVLPVGWAVGHGVGPVVLAASVGARGADALPRVLTPGARTTAHLLWRLFHPEPVLLEHVVFSDVMPRLQAGTADLGICIHEGRFTWEASGLRFVEDLGRTWEQATGCPLPLGGLVARDDLDPDALVAFTLAARRSLDHARVHPQRALATMRRWAQESSDEVLWKHVELYVSEATRDLTADARRALETLAGRAGELVARPGAALRFLSA